MQGRLLQGRFSAPYKQTSHLRLKFGKAALQRFPAGIEYDPPLGIQLFQMQPYGFAHTPPDPVAHHRLAERARRGETDPRPVRLRLPHTEGRKKRGRKAGSPIIDFAEIRGSQQAYTFRKSRDAYLSELTVSLCRPRARRRDSTARPFLVSMRVRNPCVFARLRLFG